MSQKVIYFDTETTGINPEKHSIIQFAAVIEIDGEIKEQINLKIAPHPTKEIDPQALQVHGMSEEEIMTFTPPLEAYRQLITIFSKYVNKYDRNDKFVPAGYNVRFDMDFLNKFFKECGDQYFGSYFAWQMVDALPLLYFLKFKGSIDFENYKLETACRHFGIEIQSHDALSDILATRELIRVLKSKIE